MSLIKCCWISYLACIFFAFKVNILQKETNWLIFGVYVRNGACVISTRWQYTINSWMIKSHLRRCSMRYFLSPWQTNCESEKYGLKTILQLDSGVFFTICFHYFKYANAKNSRLLYKLQKIPVPNHRCCWILCYFHRAMN